LPDKDERNSYDFSLSTPYPPEGAPAWKISKRAVNFFTERCPLWGIGGNLQKVKIIKRNEFLRRF
jgi:hypothetical protein